MPQNNELSRYNISGSLNLLHKVNRKENNLDYWYVCLVECRVNHNHLSIIRSEYIIMISCSFVDVHPAICIYQQSKSWAILSKNLLKEQRSTIADTRLGSLRCAVLVSWQQQDYVSIPEMWHKHRQTLPFVLPLLRLLYFNFQSREKTLCFCTSGIFGRGFKITWIPHSLSKMSEVPFKVMSDPKIFRVIWQFVNICGAFRQ